MLPIRSLTEAQNPLFLACAGVTVLSYGDHYGASDSFVAAYFFPAVNGTLDVLQAGAHPDGPARGGLAPRASQLCTRCVVPPCKTGLAHVSKTSTVATRVAFIVCVFIPLIDTLVN